MNSWQTKKLGDVIKLEYGKPLPKSKREENGEYPVYGANGIKSWSQSFYFGKPSIIVGRKGSAGELNLVKKRFWPLDVTYFVTFDDKKFDLKFLYNLLVTLDLPKLAKGVKPGINRNEVYDIEVKIPPLTEQKRIVKILDEVFEKVTRAKEIAEKNLQNSRELFESYLQKIFANPKQDWEMKMLNEVAKIEKIKNNRTDLPYVGMEDIESSSGFFLGSLEPKKVKSSSFYFTSEHILYGRLRPYLNKVLLPNFEGHSSTEVFPIKAGKNIDKKFLFYWFVSPNIIKKINATCTGARMPRANMDDVLDFTISFPKSLPEQKAIVKKLDELSGQTKKLEEIYRRKLELLEELKKSVLAKAFRGEL